MIDKILKKESLNLATKKKKEISTIKLLATSPWKLAGLYLDALATPTTFLTRKKTSNQGLITMATFELNKWKEIRKKTRVHFASIGLSVVGGCYGDDVKNIGVMHSLPRDGHPRKGLLNWWQVGLFKVGTGGCYDRLIQTEKYFNHYLDNGIDQLLGFHMPLLG